MILPVEKQGWSSKFREDEEDTGEDQNRVRAKIKKKKRLHYRYPALTGGVRRRW